jgi:hypothetical protein
MDPSSTHWLSYSAPPPPAGDCSAASSVQALRGCSAPRTQRKSPTVPRARRTDSAALRTAANPAASERASAEHAVTTTTAPAPRPVGVAAHLMSAGPVPRIARASAVGPAMAAATRARVAPAIRFAREPHVSAGVAAAAASVAIAVSIALWVTRPAVPAVSSSETGWPTRAAPRLPALAALACIQLRGGASACAGPQQEVCRSRHRSTPVPAQRSR